MDLCKTYFSLAESDRPAFILKHNLELLKAMPLYLKSLEQKKYFYLVTFTIPPEQIAQADKIEEYIRSQFTDRPALKVTEAHLVKELTKKGVPHWHVVVSTTTPLAKDRFQYFTKLYGNLDISKNHSQNLQDGLNYISKSGIPTRLC